MFLTLMTKLYIQLQLLFYRKDGASAIEYVIIIAMVALVILTAGPTLGTKITAFFTKIQTALGT